jgi:DNA-binding LacI/PurR family transcriptional regulator
MAWDDTDGSVQWVVIGTGLTYTQATHTLTGGATLTRATFTNANLTAGVLTITHTAGLSAPYTVMVTIFDNNNQQIIPDSITGATNTVAVDLSSYVAAGGGSIPGTWGYGYIA